MPIIQWEHTSFCQNQGSDFCGNVATVSSLFLSAHPELSVRIRVSYWKILIQRRTRFFYMTAAKKVLSRLQQFHASSKGQKFLRIPLRTPEAFCQNRG
jgi:hypothetical protein